MTVELEEYYRRELWPSALEAYEAGNTYRAFQLVNALYHHGFRPPELLKLFGLIAASYDRYDVAQRFFQKAATALDRTRSPASDRPRHILIRSVPAGFWGEVNHVVVQALVAEITGRVPLVYWGKESRYSDTSDDDAWQRHFEPLSGVRIEDLARPELTFYPSAWQHDRLRHPENWRARYMEAVVNGYRRDYTSLDFFSSDADVVVADAYNQIGDILPWLPSGHPYRSLSVLDLYRALYARYVRLNDRTRSLVENARRELLGSSPVMAVHYRTQGKDKVRESFEAVPLRPEDYFPTMDHVTTARPDLKLFVSTDFAPALDAFRARYGAKVAALPHARVSHEDQNGVDVDVALDGDRLGTEIVLDTYLAAGCDYFLGDGASAVSCAVVHLKTWPEETVQLLRENVFAQPVRSRFGPLVAEDEG